MGNKVLNGSSFVVDEITGDIVGVRNQRTGVDKEMLFATDAYNYTVHPQYHFHGWAGQQVAGDSKFLDISGTGNHGVRGANLSDAQLFATANYVSTIDPVGGSTDSVIRIPNLNFDYNGGQKLILWWLGKCTAEGANAGFMGDGGNGTYHGIKIRANTTQKAQPVLYDTTNSSGLFGGSTTGTPFDGSLHSFGMVLNGSDKTYGMWVDETFDSGLHGSTYSSFSSGTACDTTNSNTFQIGSSFPNAAASTEGIVTQTRALVIMRLTASQTVPSVATITSTFQQLRANPGKPVLKSAF